MTSFRQVEANQRNAQKSTGPKTEEGKRQSRRNAIRHGLCAETVIETVEDIEDYKAFEATIIADFDAETAVERELVLRLASLLWRIRRATSIKTDLIRLQTEVSCKRRSCSPAKCALTARYQLPLSDCRSDATSGVLNDCGSGVQFKVYPGDEFSMPGPSACRDLAHSFQRLNNLDNGAFEQFGRSESALWRQVVQVMPSSNHAAVKFDEATSTRKMGDDPRFCAGLVGLYGASCRWSILGRCARSRKTLPSLVSCALHQMYARM